MRYICFVWKERDAILRWQIRKNDLIPSYISFFLVREVLPEQEYTMKRFEEETVTALHSLFAKIKTLHQINIRDILKPDVYYRYEQTLQEAYDALTTVEDALTSLGMKLEYEHFRLGGALDELKPLLIDTRSTSDKIMEAFDQRLPWPFYEHI